MEYNLQNHRIFREIKARDKPGENGSKFQLISKQGSFFYKALKQ